MKNNSGSSSNILIFTKDKSECEFLSKMLEENNYNVKIEKEDVIGNIISYKPEVIIIDSMEMDSYVIVPNIPTIMLGIEDRSCKMEALAAGAIDYVVKPFNNKEVFYKVRNIINLSKYRDKSKIYYTFTGMDLDQSDKVVVEKSIEPTKPRKPSILLVDDDKIILSILSSRYKNKGFDVHTMLDASEALDFFKNNEVDLIITDFYMPRMSGDGFIKSIREINQQVKIIVLSGQKNEEFIKRSMELGADDYVTKPFSPVELDIRVKRLMR